jgi:hypothetical protein
MTYFVKVGKQFLYPADEGENDVSFRLVDDLANAKRYRTFSAADQVRKAAEQADLHDVRVIEVEPGKDGKKKAA